MRNLILLLVLISLTACSKSSEQAAADSDAALQAGARATKPKILPHLDTSKKTYKKLDLYQ